MYKILLLLSSVTIFYILDIILLSTLVWLKYEILFVTNYLMVIVEETIKLFDGLLKINFGWSRVGCISEWVSILNVLVLDNTKEGKNELNFRKEGKIVIFKKKRKKIE